MAELDATAIGIVMGLVVAVVVAAVNAHTRQQYDLSQTVLLALAGFSVPVGVQLIGAGIEGSPESLPSGWRVHVAVAGIVALWLAAQFVFTHLQGAFKNLRKETVGKVEEEK